MRTRKLFAPLILLLLLVVLVGAWIVHFHSDLVEPLFSHAEWSKNLLTRLAVAPEDTGGDDSDAGANLVPVKTATVTKVSFHRYIDAFGTIAPRPPRAGQQSGSAAIAAPTAGVVSRVLCEAGQKIARGDGLIQLDDRLARAAEDQANAALAQAQASLGSLMAPPRAMQVSIARLAVEKSRGAMEFAKKNNDRQQTLAAEQGTSVRSVEQAQADLASAQNDLAANEAQLALLTSPPKPQDIAQEEAKVSQAAAALAAARMQVETLKIISPIDGTVVDINVSPGEAVDATRALVDVMDLDHLTVDADVPAAQVTGLSAGQSVLILPTAAPSDGALQGKLTFISPRIDSRTGTVRIGVDLDQGAPVRAGLAVRVRVIVEERKDQLAVPLTSIVTDDSGQSIINVVAGDQAAHKAVKTGLQEGDLMEINGEGIKEGDTVVTAGAYGLPDATKVKVSN